MRQHLVRSAAFLQGFFNGLGIFLVLTHEDLVVYNMIHLRLGERPECHGGCGNKTNRGNRPTKFPIALHDLFTRLNHHNDTFDSSFFSLDFRLEMHPLICGSKNSDFKVDHSAGTEYIDFHSCVPRRESGRSSTYAPLNLRRRDGLRPHLHTENGVRLRIEKAWINYIQSGNVRIVDGLRIAFKHRRFRSCRPNISFVGNKFILKFHTLQITLHFPLEIACECVRTRHRPAV